LAILAETLPTPQSRWVSDTSSPPLGGRNAGDELARILLSLPGMRKTRFENTPSHMASGQASVLFDKLSADGIVRELSHRA
jgi:hypothetical protein